jgi:chorismate mutase/prephenate dehydratase
MISPTVVAFQGIKGSFSSVAADALCGPFTRYLHTQHFREIFEYVSRGEAQIGVVPLENALAGTIQENYDLLEEYSVHIVAEHYLPVQLDLLGVQGSEGVSREQYLADLKEVVSHPKALEQCSKFFEIHRHIKQVVFSDTAGAAQYVKERGDPLIAAIASSYAADLLHLKVVAPAIQNHSTNITRFIAIASDPTSNVSAFSSGTPGAKSKCSATMLLQHVPGALYKALGELYRIGVNVTKIESRPLPGSPFEYRFYFDVTGAEAPEKLAHSVVEALSNFTVELRILGAYESKSEVS